MMKTDDVINTTIVVALVAVIVGLLVSIYISGKSVMYPPDSPAESTMTLEEGREIATALNHYVWPDGAIIHKRLGNGWVCVEIDGHHLLVHNRGNSTFGVAVDSCIEE